MVRLCKIKVWDEPTGQWIVQTGKFTQPALMALPRAESIPREDEEVAEAAVDGNGRYLFSDESDVLGRSWRTRKLCYRLSSTG
jgi:hypothetical protein